MEYRTLGRTGVEVSVLSLGAMMFGAWGNEDHQACVRIVREALDAGINLIDTADIYSRGESEQIVGKALARLPREAVFLATKVSSPMCDEPNSRGGSRRWITHEVEQSLRRLGVDHIDLYQLHRPDPTCDIEETLGILTDLQRAGKIRYAGTSTFAAHELVEAQWAAERAALIRPRCEQAPYSMLARRIEADVLPVAQSYGMGVLTWSPLSGGLLAGGRPGTGRPGTGRPGQLVRQHHQHAASSAEKAKQRTAQQLAAVAQQFGLTPIQLALAFAINHPAVTSVIIGPRTGEQLTSQLAGAAVQLPAEALDAIDAIVPPGTTINPADVARLVPALAKSRRRR
jgi:aryl-alcohol dehydrogenase-like predicted oxidoreductase